MMKAPHSSPLRVVSWNMNRRGVSVATHRRATCAMRGIEDFPFPQEAPAELRPLDLESQSTGRYRLESVKCVE